MERLLKILDGCMNEELVQIIISNKRKADVGKKVVVRPFEEKGKLIF